MIVDSLVLTSMETAWKFVFVLCSACAMAGNNIQKSQSNESCESGCMAFGFTSRVKCNQPILFSIVQEERTSFQKSSFDIHFVKYLVHERRYLETYLLAFVILVASSPLLFRSHSVELRVYPVFCFSHVIF